MNTEALFLFLILLLGLVLCSFLGGNCNKEGFNSNSNSSQNNNNMSSNSMNPNNNNTNNNNTNNNNTNNQSSPGNYDNYNHYSGSSSQLSSGTKFYGPNGGSVVVSTSNDGTQSLQVILSNNSSPITLTPSQSNSTTEGYTTYGGANGSATTFYGPNGVSATVATVNGQQAIKVTTQNGTTTFTQQGPANTNSNNSNISSSQYYGSTGTPIQASGMSYQGSNGGSAGSVTGPGGNTAYYAQGPGGNAVAGTTSSTYPYNNISSSQYNGPYGGNAGSISGPGGNTAYYAQGPGGNMIAGMNGGSSYNPYSSVLPPGIPASQIPPGQEDLYILKSEVIPPVCPACPTSSSCPREEPCPACPPCGRCPEPAFDCKKVPNYNAIDNSYLPAPVLNDFSSFGM